MARWVDDTAELEIITPDGNELFRAVKDGRSVAIRSGTVADADTAAAIAAHVSALDPHTQYLTEAAAAGTYLTQVSASDTYEPRGYAYETRALVALSEVPLLVTYIRTAGYATVGDGGEARYKRVGSEPSHAGKVQSADGAWWEIVGDEVSPLQFGAKFDGQTIDSVAVQDAIDFLPSTGGIVRAPSGVVLVTDISLNGTNGDKSNVLLIGSGMGATIFRKPDHSDLTTAQEKRSNVVHCIDGAGCKIARCSVEGNKSRGGTKPLYGSVWTPNRSYTYTGADTFVVSTKSDGTTVTPGDQESVSLANGGRMFLLRSTHTAGASNILTDLGLGRWEEVTDQPWDEDTATGYTGYWENDGDYSYRHGIYFAGQTAPTTDCIGEEVEVRDAVYGGFVSGSGPLFNDELGIAGTDRTVWDRCVAIDNGGSNFGGGHNRLCTMLNPKTSGGASSGIRLDEESHGSQIIAPIVESGGSLNNGGIFAYKSDRCKIISPRVRGTSLAVWTEQCDDTEIIDPDVSGGVIRIQQPVGGKLAGGLVSGSPSQGIYISNGTDFSILGTASESNTTEGILWETMQGGVIAPSVVRLNGREGVKASNWFRGTLGQFSASNNGTNTGYDTVRPAIRMVDCEHIAGGMAACFDTRSGGARTQTHAITLDTDCASCSVSVANSNNSVGTFVDGGSGNFVTVLSGGALVDWITGANRDLRRDIDGAMAFRSINASAGSNASSRLLASNGAQEGGIILRGTGHANPSRVVLYSNSSAEGIEVLLNSIRRAFFPQLGGMIIGPASAALTTATDGFLYIPSCAGTPTGVPTAQTGKIPIIVDSTNHKLYFYSGGAWRDAGP